MYFVTRLEIEKLFTLEASGAEEVKYVWQDSAPSWWPAKSVAHVPGTALLFYTHFTSVDKLTTAAKTSTKRESNVFQKHVVMQACES